MGSLWLTLASIPSDRNSIRSDTKFRCGSRRCENSCVGPARGSFFSITLNRKRTALAAIVERGKSRKQFCDRSARARFHTPWVIFGSRFWRLQSPLFPHERTSLVATCSPKLAERRRKAEAIPIMCWTAATGFAKLNPSCDLLPDGLSNVPDGQIS
jgi:hypothetical protein